MDNNFLILGHNLTFSDEKINYVRLKWVYQRKAWEIEEEMKGIMPKAKKGSILDEAGFTLATTVSSLTQFSGVAKSFLSDGTYGDFNIFLEERKNYVNKYVESIEKQIDELAEELSAHNIEIDKERIFIDFLNESDINDDINSATDAIISSRSGSSWLSNDETKPTLRKICNYYTEKANIEYDDKYSGNGKETVIFRKLILPLNHCFLQIIKTDLGEMQIDPTDSRYSETNRINVAQKCSKIVFQRKEIQDAFVNNIRYDVFRFFNIKKNLFEKENLENYQEITYDETEHAKSLYRNVTTTNMTEDDEKDVMAEILQTDPFQSKYYTMILDKYFDENGDIQRLAKATTVNVTTHIENYITNIYNEGSIGTLESTLELKERILEAENKFCYSNSKAFKDVTLRQHFLELSRMANEMSIDEVREQWESIKNGNNTFAVGERSDVDDEMCILILKRRFLKIHAAEYHDTIRDLGLKDDSTNGEKNYAFYEEGEDYVDFEEECEKIIGVKIERDEDFSVQNYSEDKFASGEVILGYFHYTRALDVISDGKNLLITNKRIYTTKEKFTDFSCISECKPVKKLMLSYLVFEKNDGKTIQLPVSKELMLPAADMINRLIAALKGTTYVAESVAISDSNNMAAAKSMIFGTANSVKKGFGSLFGKKLSQVEDKTQTSWICNCGSKNKGAFCPKCGTQRP